MRSRTAMMVLTIAAAGLVGCGSGARPSGSGAATQAAADIHEQSGAQLWADNCSRCHNIRPPQSFSDSQWQAIVHHMRLRANLTGQEQRKITEFLQASH